MLEREYPHLYHLFGGYFPDRDFDDLSDEDVVQYFVRVMPSGYVLETRKELDILLSSGSIPCDNIGDVGNVYFENHEDCVAWLNEIRRMLIEHSEKSSG